MISKLSLVVSRSPVSPTLPAQDTEAWRLNLLDRLDRSPALVSTRRLAVRARPVDLGQVPPRERGRRTRLRRRLVACWRLALQLTCPAIFEFGWRLFLLAPSGRPRVRTSTLRLSVARCRLERREQVCRPLTVAAGMVPGAGLLAAQFRRTAARQRMEAAADGWMLRS